MRSPTALPEPLQALPLRDPPDEPGPDRQTIEQIYIGPFDDTVSILASKRMRASEVLATDEIENTKAPRTDRIVSENIGQSLN